MIRIVLGAIAGLCAWMILWFGAETLISALWPAFGAHQAAFQAAIENDGPFTADPTMLSVHIVMALIVSAAAGFISALVAGENKRAPLFLGIVLLIVGLLKAFMSWPLVPIWYHGIFTAVLLPMALIGGRLRSAAGR